MASLGDSVAGAGAEICCPEVHDPPAGWTAARIADVSSSISRQTATMLPAPSDAIRGVDPEAPPRERSAARLFVRDGSSSVSFQGVLAAVELGWCRSHGPHTALTGPGLRPIGETRPRKGDLHDLYNLCRDSLHPPTLL
jgi:hypothetical protein